MIAFTERNAAPFWVKTFHWNQVSGDVTSQDFDLADLRHKYVGDSWLISLALNRTFRSTWTSRYSC